MAKMLASWMLDQARSNELGYIGKRCGGYGVSSQSRLQPMSATSRFLRCFNYRLNRRHIIPSVFKMCYHCVYTDCSCLVSGTWISRCCDLGNVTSLMSTVANSDPRPSHLSLRGPRSLRQFVSRLSAPKAYRIFRTHRCVLSI